MNAVDRSDQILGTNNVHRKCVRGWKTLFFHLIDIAVVNSYILFQEHRTNCPDEPALKRRATYSLVNYREEVLPGLCGFPEYGPPPGQAAPKPAPPSPDALRFVTEHIPYFSEERKTCVVCWQKEKKNSTKSTLTVKRHSVIGICIYQQVTKIVLRYIIHRITLINVETTLKYCNFHFLSLLV